MSYVTITEADSYVQSHYMVSDCAYTYWTALDDASKQVLLTRAFDRIEQLPFVGRKTEYTQVNQFPRYPDLVVPQIAKDAQVIEAISSSSPDAAAQKDLRMRNVTSYTIGHLSEQFAPGTRRFGDPVSQVSPETLAKLAPYLTGGYRIC